MTTQHDFLTEPTTERLRKEILNICDSYSHTWDVIAEMCQNSVDAIHSHIRAFGETARDHEINISIDAIKRSISIRDTGVGFSKDKFINLIAPHGTDKDPNDFKLIGQKGVGLTYVIFSSDKFDICSKSIANLIKGGVKNAVLWKNGKIEDPPQFLAKTFKNITGDPKETYTEISIQGVENIFEEEEDIFFQTPEIIEYILRTKTAIGSTVSVFTSEKEKLKVTLSLTNMNGKTINRPIDPSFMLPEEFIKSKDFMDYDDLEKLAATLDDRGKTQRLQGKCLRKKGSITRSGRDIDFYAFFAPSRKFWKSLSERNNLTRKSSGAEDEDMEYLYTAGIFISSRGMPTGITLTHPATGEAGYWPNIFILLEDNRIIFDLGRKYVPARTQGLLKEIARGLFNEFLKFRKYITTDPPTSQTLTTIQQYEKSEIFKDLEKLPDIGISKICYLKHPNSQEAAIVAIFHELLGAKILKGYSSFKHGYKETYDLWGQYIIMKDNVGKNVGVKEGTNLPMIIEFKYRAEDILVDFEKENKYFSDIDLIVCWDLDEVRFSKENVLVNLVKPEDALFHGSNYELEWPGSYNLGYAGKKPVLVLRKFIEDYRLKN